MAFKRTVYPYGLNQLYNHTNYYNQCLDENSEENIYSLFPPNSKHQKRYKRGSKKYKSNNPTMSTIKNDLRKYEFLYQRFDIGGIKNGIFAIKSKNLQMYYNEVENVKVKNQFHHLIKDLLKYRATFVRKQLKKIIHDNKKQKNSYCVFNFTNKNLNSININAILSNNEKLFPIKHLQVKSAFKYGKNIGRMMFNYNCETKNFKGTSKEIADAKCLCDQEQYLQFVNKEYGHIITGNLDIVNDTELKTIMEKGTKFRFKNLNNKQNIINNIYTDIDSYIYKISGIYRIPVSFFIEWKFSVVSQIKQSLLAPFKQNNNHSHINDQIKKLKDNFIITYVDKAAGNFAFICKKFYLQNLVVEFTTSKLFKKENLKQPTVSKRIIALYKRMKQKPDNLNYPYIILIPKLHKNPVSFRTVTMGHQTYNTKASLLLLKELKVIENNILKHENPVFVKNSYELKNKLSKINTFQSVNTLDFKDMFNNIKQDSLFDIILNIYKEYKNINEVNYELSDFELLLGIVIKNNYVIYGGDIYRQIEGIPQGLASSNSLANIYLHCFERKNWKQNTSVYLFRYIDDIIKFKIDDNNIDYALDYYPTNLQLIKTNNYNDEAVFLDLKINIKNNQLIFDIFKKQTNLNFKVISMQDFDSNLHFGLFENIIFNQIQRVNNLCSKNNRITNIIEICKVAKQYHYPYSLIDKVKMKCERKQQVNGYK